MRAVKEAGYEPGRQIAFALDVAASELYNKDSGLMISRRNTVETGRVDGKRKSVRE